MRTYFEKAQFSQAQKRHKCCNAYYELWFAATVVVLSKIPPSPGWGKTLFSLVVSINN